MQPEQERTGVSGGSEDANSKQLLPLGALDLGQRCPHYCPEHCPQARSADSDRLGAPLSIREVARLIGCSVWTVRHRFLPHGLPHFRVANSGKLVFFRNQVTLWILEKQQPKGGV